MGKNQEKKDGVDVWTEDSGDLEGRADAKLWPHRTSGFGTGTISLGKRQSLTGCHALELHPPTHFADESSSSSIPALVLYPLEPFDNFNKM